MVDRVSLWGERLDGSSMSHHVQKVTVDVPSALRFSHPPIRPFRDAIMSSGRRGVEKYLP